MKNYLRKLSLPLAFITFVLLIINACKKDQSASQAPPAGKQNVSLFLSDAPGYFDNVMLDIRKVEVLVDTCAHDGDDDDWDDKDRCWWDEDRHDDHDRRGQDTCNVWDSLAIRPGVYDLLTLRNGADTLLANGQIRKGTLKQIRITIGDNNSLVKDSISYPLKSIKGQSRIIVRVRHNEWDEVTPDNLRLWLDFDIQRSIIQVKHGQFILRPYITIFTILKMGSLSGKVTPMEAFPVISVFNNTDTLYALPWRAGEFKIRGIKTGSYSVFVNASNGYQDTTLLDIKIDRGRDTQLGNIKLHK
jgi:hypothetical protein